MNRCKTCKWWKQQKDDDGHYSEIVKPTKSWDSDEPLPVEFQVRFCTHPKLLFYERPTHADGLTVVDGSMYTADLLTAENFGCVLHEIEA